VSAKAKRLERADYPTFLMAPRYNLPDIITLSLVHHTHPFASKQGTSLLQLLLAKSAVRADRTKTFLAAAGGGDFAPIRFAGVWVSKAGDLVVSRGISSHLLGLCRSGAAGGVMFDGVVTSGTGLSATLLNAGEALAPLPRDDLVLFVELMAAKIPKRQVCRRFTLQT
jgi:hypothetical protein